MTTFQNTVDFAPLAVTSLQSRHPEARAKQSASSLGAAIVLFVLWAVGTGGIPKVSGAPPAPTSSGGTWVRARNVTFARSVAPAAQRGHLSIQDRVVTIRQHLSLNMSQLAKGLGVGRAALYGWLSDESTPRAKHLTRLKDLYDIATYWGQLSAKPLGKYLIMPLDNGVSVARLLTKSQLPTREIKDALDLISHDMIATEARKQASGYRSVRDVMKARGYPDQAAPAVDLDDVI